MSTTISYKPLDIPPESDQAQRFNFTGDNIMLIFYGIAVMIFVDCFRVLLRLLKTPGGNTTSKRIQLAYACAIFACGTLFLCAEIWQITVSTLDFPLYPGGPFMWINDNYNLPVVMLGNAMFEVTTWLADGFMLFRCYIVYTLTTGMWYILLLPGLLYLASVATGIFLLVQVSHPNSSLFENVNFALTNFSITASLNVVITVLISMRLIVHRYRMQKVMGRGTTTQSFGMYTSISTILIESSALYSIFFLMFIIPFAMERPVAKLFLPMLAMVQVISPLLVSLRLAKEMAWTTTTTQQLSGSHDMKFQARGQTSVGASTTNFTASQGHAVAISLETRKDYSYSDPKV